MLASRRFSFALRCGLLCAAMIMAGCDSKSVDPPAKLVDINAVLDVDKVWSESLGGGGERFRLALQPMVVDGVVYAAARKGAVEALAADQGKQMWRTKTKLELSAGPTVGEGLVVVGGTNGELLALDLATGAERWRRQLSSEVLAKPAIGNGVVVVHTLDSRLQAFNVADGSPRWSTEETNPKLTLRGSGAPLISGAVVLSGFDNGRLVAVEVDTGDVLWNVAIDTPTGRTELDKLADIDTLPAVSGRDVFVAGYQGRVAMLDLDNGQLWWAKDASSYRGFGLDERNLYLTRSNGSIAAMRRTDGNVQWETDTLHQRGLTAPIPVGDSLVVGDYEGYVHWLSKTDGKLLARAKTDGERITNAPVVADGRVFVQTDGGKLIAFATQFNERKAEQAAAAEAKAAAAAETAKTAEQSSAKHCKYWLFGCG